MGILILMLYSDSFCSHPAGACFQYLATNGSTPLPTITYAFSPLMEAGLPAPNITCLDNSTISVRGLVSNPGMLYEILGKVLTLNLNEAVSVSCNPTRSATKGMHNATLTVVGASEAGFTWVGGTNYDINAGDKWHDFSFRGSDPHVALLSLLTSMTSSTISYASIVSSHISDYTAVMSPFALSLGQRPNLTVPTDKLVEAYKTDVGDPYLEWLLFNYGRYLLASSARGVLPANLQGKWAKGIYNPWGAGSFDDIFELAVC